MLDNMSIHAKAVFEPFAALLFKHPKEVQFSIINSLSALFGHNHRTDQEFAVFEWAIKIIALAYDHGIPHEAIVKLLNINSSAIMYYQDNRSFEGFRFDLEN